MDWFSNFFIFNPNYHSHLKLLNYHGVDGKSWFKKQGPLCVNARDYWVAAPFLPRFFQSTLSHVPPPSPSTGKKRQKHPGLYALFKHTYNAQIFTNIFLVVIQSFMNSFFEKNLGLITQKQPQKFVTQAYAFLHSISKICKNTLNITSQCCNFGYCKGWLQTVTPLDIN